MSNKLIFLIYKKNRHAVRLKNRHADTIQTLCMQFVAVWMGLIFRISCMAIPFSDDTVSDDAVLSVSENEEYCNAW
jgi:hypothetical protein